MQSVHLKICKVFLIPMLSAFICACSNSAYESPAFSENGHLNMVVEIPAGTNKKYEINRESGEFELEIIDGKPRKVEFLPYPTNYGFVPSTLMHKSTGGDGDPLDVLLIAEAIPQGVIVEVIPIGLLLLHDRGEEDHKVLAIPADEALRTVTCSIIACMKQKYPAALDIIASWFSNYKGSGVMEFKGWADEKAAIDEIKKWSVSDEKK